MTKLEFQELEVGMIARGCGSGRIIMIERLLYSYNNKRRNEIEYRYLDTDEVVTEYDYMKCVIGFELPHINPKFKIGDTITYFESNYKICKIDEEGYYDTNRHLCRTFFANEHLLKKVDVSEEKLGNEVQSKIIFKEDKKMMNSNQKEFLPKDVHELVEAGVLCDNLLLTKYGVDVVLNNLVKDDKIRKALVEKVRADRKKAEEKE